MEEQKKFSKFSLILWIFGIVVIIVVGVIIYVVMTQNSDTNANTNAVGIINQNTNATANANAVTNTNIDTSDWLIYENEEYGFSIKFPSDWERGIGQHTSSENVIYFDPFYKDDPTKGSKDNHPAYAYISMYVIKRLNNETVQELLDQKYQECLEDPANSDMGCPGPEDTSSWQNITIDGKVALRSGIIDDVVEHESLYITYDNYFVVFDGLYYNEESYNFSPIWEEIIKNIQIID